MVNVTSSACPAGETRMKSDYSIGEETEVHRFYVCLFVSGFVWFVFSFF